MVHVQNKKNKQTNKQTKAESKIKFKKSATKKQQQTKKNRGQMGHKVTLISSIMQMRITASSNCFQVSTVGSHYKWARTNVRNYIDQSLIYGFLKFKRYV